jgi:hypothetical protein
MVTSSEKFYVTIDPAEDINKPIVRHKFKSKTAARKFAASHLARPDDGSRATLVMSARMLGTGVHLLANLLIMSCDISFDRDGEPTETTAANIIQKIGRVVRATRFRYANGTHKTARVVFMTKVPLVHDNGEYAMERQHIPEALRIALRAYSVAEENVELIGEIDIGAALPNLPVEGEVSDDDNDGSDMDVSSSDDDYNPAVDDSDDNEEGGDIEGGDSEGSDDNEDNNDIGGSDDNEGGDSEGSDDNEGGDSEGSDDNEDNNDIGGSDDNEDNNDIGGSDIEGSDDNEGSETGSDSDGNEDDDDDERPLIRTRITNGHAYGGMVVFLEDDSCGVQDPDLVPFPGF